MECLKKYKRKVQKIVFKEQWYILLEDREKNKRHILRPPENIHWADPFPIKEGDKYYIFLEEQIKGQNGTIGYIEINDQINLKYNKVLERNYHMSYPYIFKLNTNSGDRWFLIPETHENKKIDLYYAERFPDRWVLETTLIDGIEAVDSTLLYYENKWWLFTSVKEGKNNLNNSLFIFYSNVFPTNNWKPHQKNPVVTGIERSRMAGRIYFDIKIGKYIRPAQNCKAEYGKMIHLFSIDELTEKEYKESLVETIYPEKKYNIVCTHTYNIIENSIVRDVKERRFKLFRYRELIG